MGERREYSLRITVNGRVFRRVIIDDHFQKKHGESVDDFLILRLVRMLDGRRYWPDSINEDGFSYFKKDPLVIQGKPYRLVWTTHPLEDYVGVVNVFRRPYGKEEA